MRHSWVGPFSGFRPRWQSQQTQNLHREGSTPSSRTKISGDVNLTTDRYALGETWASGASLVPPKWTESAHFWGRHIIGLCCLCTAVIGVQFPSTPPTTTVISPGNELPANMRGVLSAVDRLISGNSQVWPMALGLDPRDRRFKSCFPDQFGLIVQ